MLTIPIRRGGGGHVTGFVGEDELNDPRAPGLTANRHPEFKFDPWAATRHRACV